jgi:hypothetical protein
MCEGRQGRKPGDPAQMEGIYSYTRNGHKWPTTRRIIFLLNFKALMRFAGSWRRFADRVWALAKVPFERGGPVCFRGNGS